MSGPASNSHQSQTAAAGRFAGGSLYAGISLSSDKKPSGDDLAKGDGIDVEGGGQGMKDTKSAGTSSSKASSTWSSALSFAPRKSAGSAGTRKPNRAPPAVIASMFNSGPSAIDEDAEVKQNTHAAPGRSKSSVAAGATTSGRTSVARSATAPQNEAPANQPSAHQTPESSTSQSLQPSQPPKPPPATTSKPVVSIFPSISSKAQTYVLPAVTSPPETRLPQEELDRDRSLAREAAIARGERQAWPSNHDGSEVYWDEGSGGGWDEGHGDEEEDVNGFAASAAGARANKKKKYKRKRANAAPAAQSLVNWDADYDPRTPNDYSAWKEVVRNRREAVKRAQERERWDSGRGRRDDADADADASYEYGRSGGWGRGTDESESGPRRWGGDSSSYDDCDERAPGSGAFSRPPHRCGPRYEE